MYERIVKMKFIQYAYILCRLQQNNLFYSFSRAIKIIFTFTTLFFKELNSIFLIHVDFKRFQS